MQPVRDFYYHNISVQQITNLLSLTTYTSCSTIISQDNHYPVVSTDGFIRIPKGTTFYLHANASDEDNPDILTYCWDQMDAEQASYPLNSSSTSGPLFRSFPPTDNPKRYFPSLSTTFQGQNSYTQPSTSTWEVLPTVPRLMTFGVTVRDNNPIGGGLTKQANTYVSVEDVEPFYLTYPNNLHSSPALLWNVGDQETITWNVGGTVEPPINTTHVNIYFTTDDMDTLVPLAENVENNGSQTITVPDVNSSNLRVVIIPTNSTYFAISKPITIEGWTSVKQFDFEEFHLYPNPTNSEVTVSFVVDNPSKVRIELFDLNGRLILQKDVQAERELRENISLQSLSVGTYLLKISNGKQSITKKIIKK